MIRAALAVLIILLSPPALADFAGALEQYRRGDYDGALTELDRVSKAERIEASLLRVDIDILRGDYERATKAAERLNKNSSSAATAVKLAEVYAQLGRLDEAHRLLEPLATKDLKATPRKNPRARYLLGLVYREKGDFDGAQTLFKSLYDDYQNRRLDERDPEQLFYLAEAGRYLESFQFANGFYGDALALDPKFHEANIAWGRLFLFKYNIGAAEKSFRDVLAIDATHPDAHAGMARVKLEQSYDIEAATAHLEQALKTNPKHIPSLQIRAEIAIDRNRWSAARKTIREILAINPNHLGAKAQLATVLWLRDDPGYAKLKKEILASNPKFAELFHTIARSAVREHRYDKAIELELEALSVDPDYYLAMAEIGSGYLRMGNEDEGLKWLRRAYEKDAYNVRTVNLLELFEIVIAKEYTTSKSKTFRFRWHREEQPMLERHIAPTLERAYADMVRRYQFTPKTPITIELYRDPDHYGVRTVGLPNLGALGVCFGEVITARSPFSGELNWGMILWHELAHVFAIQMSKSRVPRWYTEGLSEYETMIARPEWRRENDADLYDAMKAGKLPGVGELNYGFMGPDMQSVVVAYYLSAVTIEYIAETYGFDRVVRGLELFGKGLETEAVIQDITGKSIAAFDAEFRSYLEKRLASYDRSFRLPSSGRDDVKALEAAAKKEPSSPAVWANLALGHFFDGNARKTQAAVQKALELDDDNAIGLYLSGELALRAGNLESAKSFYEKMLASGIDGAEIRGRLAAIASQSKAWDEAEKHLCAAKALDPERPYPYLALAELSTTRGDKDRALAELETYVHLEQMQYGPLKKLLAELTEKQSWDKVRYYGEMALYMNPSDGEMLLALGRSYLETGAPASALPTYRAALELEPPLRRPAQAHLGMAKALRTLGRKGDAKAAVREALRLEPNDAEALALDAELN